MSPPSELRYAARELWRAVLLLDNPVRAYHFCIVKADSVELTTNA